METVIVGLTPSLRVKNLMRNNVKVDCKIDDDNVMNVRMKDMKSDVLVMSNDIMMKKIVLINIMNDNDDSINAARDVCKMMVKDNLMNVKTKKRNNNRMDGLRMTVVDGNKYHLIGNKSMLSKIKKIE